MLAAYLYAQLEVREAIQAKRQQVWEYYYEQLQDWAQQHNIRFPIVPKHCDQHIICFIC
jgi:dTDP-4-amino-4,6-dideoxygalactose transaminase